MIIDKNEILNLIKNKKEGDYWDFKEKPYANKACLLHDILSFSNTVCKKNKYIIVGISNDGNIIGLNPKVENRKRKSDYIDFLRNIKFSGDERPKIEVETIIIENKEIDIIIIMDDSNKTYYLSEDYRDENKVVKDNFIYTRVGDTNTPINKSADKNIIENMWKEKFNMDLTPNQKYIKLLLDYDNWKYDGISKAYYDPDLEYSLEIIDDEENNEGLFWWQMILYEKPVSCFYNLLYKDKILKKIPIVHFNNEKLMFPYPCNTNITYPKAKDKLKAKYYYDIFYYYKNSVEYSLFCHIRNIENSNKEVKIEPLVKTQIKPAIIEIPILFFSTNEELEKIITCSKQQFNKFDQDSSKIRYEVEKDFSYWIYNEIYT
ncbi:ATP-binding protein [Marispirochaeta aestuarii]|uniref:ATP-binding protein n=1 Tax=Marispirochaeta aestuarii TaxID=1963862 RepID=UPI002ABDD874|nr:ATP-binding protein [Marispirochaeta aestuarii]